MREVNRAIKQIKYFNESVKTLKNTDLTKMSKKDFWINRLKYLAWYIPMYAIFITAAYVAEKDIMDSRTLIIFLIFISLILILPAILAIIIPYKIWKKQNKEKNKWGWK